MLMRQKGSEFQAYNIFPKTSMKIVFQADNLEVKKAKKDGSFQLEIQDSTTDEYVVRLINALYVSSFHW